MVREWPCSRPVAEKNLKPEVLGSLWGPLCALHGTWAFVSRASEPVLAPGTEKQVQEGAESTGVMGRRGQERPVTLDGAPGSWLIPAAQTSRDPRTQRLVLAWLVRDKAAVASLFPATALPPPTPILSWRRNLCVPEEMQVSPGLNRQCDLASPLLLEDPGKKVQCPPLHLAGRWD